MPVVFEVKNIAFFEDKFIKKLVCQSLTLNGKIKKPLHF